MMRPLRLFRRWKFKLKRAIARYGPHPYTAIYLEALRRRYVRLGRRLAKRYEQKPPLSIPALPAPKITPFEEWPAPPDWLTALLPRPQPPQVLNWPTGAWRAYYLSEHPHLCRNTEPIDKVPTVRILEEDTVKARGIMREQLKTGERIP